MKINYDGRLITTSLTVTFRGRVKHNRIDGSIPFYTKIMDRIEIGARSIENIEIDVGILPKDHRGPLRLDILKQQNFIIDLKTLKLRN
ncbi:hypothetical protein [Paenibacillus motobuensis]|uniref:Lipid/polyisoprenoid-binding YceI-like domain-containing protein n=1 Tax=Paenibacillus motobuensis TaxID=295324 RepID=A0ABP3I1E3_9BACL